VQDPLGAAVTGARITLRNVATGVTAHAQSDGSGNYQFLNVKIGTYEVAGEKEGFAKAVARDVNVTVNARQRVDLALQTGGITEEIVEAFNVLNKTNFQVPDSNASNIRRDAQGNAIAGGTFGTIRSIFPARQVQLALKLYF
jgi:hypothetical protein